MTLATAQHQNRLSINLSQGATYQPPPVEALADLDDVLYGGFPPMTNAEKKVAYAAWVEMTEKWEAESGSQPSAPGPQQSVPAARRRIENAVDAKSLAPRETAAICSDWGLIPNQRNRRRVNRALDIVRADGIRFLGTTDGNDEYHVKSQSEKDALYDVSVNGATACSCPAHGRNYHDTAEIGGMQSRCKHSDAVLVAEWLDRLSIAEDLAADKAAECHGW